jgi:trans-feruloyl-CoA hydratase/vanillin synthase
MPVGTIERETIRIVNEGDGITWLYMNRPEKRNAMSPTMHREMYEALLELETDDDTQVLVLTGAGEAFSAGQDLKEYFRDLDGKPKEQLKMSWINFAWRWERLSQFPKITIAMVNGWCVGGAFTQLIACDFAIAAEEAQFCLSEVNWGILPGGMVTKAVAECMRYRDALYYILTAEVFDGRRAAELGLVNYAVPLARLKEETVALARRLMAKNPAVLRAAKQAYRMVRRMDDLQALDYLAAKSAELRLQDPERGRDKGLSQFIDEKLYKPVFSPYLRDR